MLRGLFIVACLMAACSAPPRARVAWSRRGHGRIVNGEPAVITDYPCVLATEFLVRQECGGSIISTTWAMSAGHCFYDDVNKMSLRAGSTPSEQFPVGSNIQIVNLPSKIGYEAPAGLPVTVVGWGLDDDGNRPEQLQKVDLSVGKTSICKDIFADYNPVTESMMCASAINKSPCNGDSGSPLVFGSVQVGIASEWDENCEYPQVVYTSIAFDVSFYQKCGQSSRADADVVVADERGETVTDV
ncbi:trypsin beta-like [Schistocerca americana]|uniref:trypsin beta-like n=1 Tax=Schistocerca americana TaxID=7009 RepID=UPI001F4FECBC|nr:trypsin beta-like [Schistocerca americana]